MNGLYKSMLGIGLGLSLFFGACESDSKTNVDKEVIASANPKLKNSKLKYDPDYYGRDAYDIMFNDFLELYKSKFGSSSLEITLDRGETLEKISLLAWNHVMLAVINGDYFSKHDEDWIIGRYSPNSDAIYGAKVPPIVNILYNEFKNAGLVKFKKVDGVSYQVIEDTVSRNIKPGESIELSMENIVNGLKSWQP